MRNTQIWMGLGWSPQILKPLRNTTQRASHFVWTWTIPSYRLPLPHYTGWPCSAWKLTCMWTSSHNHVYSSPAQPSLRRHPIKLEEYISHPANVQVTSFYRASEFSLCFFEKSQKAKVEQSLPWHQKSREVGPTFSALQFSSSNLQAAKVKPSCYWPIKTALLGASLSGFYIQKATPLMVNPRFQTDTWSYEIHFGPSGGHPCEACKS